MVSAQWPPATCRRGLRCVWGCSKVYQERVSVSGCWAPIRCIAEAAPRMHGQFVEFCNSTMREGVGNTRPCVMRETGLGEGHWLVQWGQSAPDHLRCLGVHCGVCVCAHPPRRQEHGEAIGGSPDAASNADGARFICICLAPYQKTLRNRSCLESSSGSQA
jgi:hypothetical protein